MFKTKLLLIVLSFSAGIIFVTSATASTLPRRDKPRGATSPPSAVPAIAKRSCRASSLDQPAPRRWRPRLADGSVRDDCRVQ